MRFLPLVLLAVACGNPNKALEACDEVCPAGTAPAVAAEVSEAFDLDIGADPATYSGELAFSRVGEGACEQFCLTIQPCPEDTFPVITTECFTCGLINPESGAVDQGSCSDL